MSIKTLLNQNFSLNSLQKRFSVNCPGMKTSHLSAELVFVLHSGLLCRPDAGQAARTGSRVLTQVTAASRAVSAALQPVHDVLQMSSVAAALTPHKQPLHHMVAHRTNTGTLVAPERRPRICQLVLQQNLRDIWFLHVNSTQDEHNSLQWVSL